MSDEAFTGTGTTQASAPDGHAGPPGQTGQAGPDGATPNTEGDAAPDSHIAESSWDEGPEPLHPGIDPNSPYVNGTTAPPVPIANGGGWLLYKGPTLKDEKRNLISQEFRNCETSKGPDIITTRRELITDWVEIPGTGGRGNKGDKVIRVRVQFTDSEQRTWQFGVQVGTDTPIKLTGSGSIAVASGESTLAGRDYTFDIPDDEYEYRVIPVAERQRIRTQVITPNFDFPRLYVEVQTSYEKLTATTSALWQLNSTTEVYSDIGFQVFRRKW